MKLDQWPLSEVPGQMIAILKGPDNANDQDVGVWPLESWVITRERESYRAMVNIEHFLFINKMVSWYDGGAFSHSKGAILTDVRKQIGDLDIADRQKYVKDTELLKVYADGC